MFTVVITEKGGAQRRMEFDKNEVTIGRVQGNDIILPKGNVSKRHSRIVLKDNRFIVVDLKSTNGTYVNGRKITSPLVVKAGDKIYIGDFILTLDEAAAAAAGAGPSQPPPAFAEPPPVAAAAPPMPMPMPQPAPEPRRGPPPLRSQPPMGGGPGPSAAPPMPSARAAAPPPLPARSPMQSEPAPPMATAPQSAVAPGDRFALDEEPSEDGPAPIPRVSPAPPGRQRVDSAARLPQPSPMEPPVQRPQSRPQVVVPSPQQQMMAAAAPQMAPAPQIQQPAPVVPIAPAPQPAPVHSRPTRPPVAPGPKVRQPIAPVAPGDLDGSVRAVMTRLSESFDVGNADPWLLGDQARWEQAQQSIHSALGELQGERLLDGGIDRDQLVGNALREAVGLGALEALLTNPNVREIVVEAPGRIVADMGNGLEPVQGTFSSADSLMTVARRLVGQSGHALDPSRPVSEALLPDGTRVLVVQPPIALRGPVVEIRRVQRPVQPQDLVERGMISNEMLELLRSAVRGRRNVVVSGPIGAGVTTLLAGIAGLTSESERIVTVEEVPDLALPRQHVIALCTGGPRGLTMRQLMQQANRLRCDRMVIDDIRGEEARDVLVTMAARRDGTLAGVHATSAMDALAHLELLARLDSSSQSTAVRQLLSEAVHLVVQVGRLEDGTRRVTAITEVVGLAEGQIETQDLYVWQDEFLSTGNEPRFLRG